jgi:hypothetical protein
MKSLPTAGLLRLYLDQLLLLRLRLLLCSYEVRSGRRIALVFEEAQLGKVGSSKQELRLWAYVFL